MTGIPVAGLGSALWLVSSCDYRVTDWGMMAGLAQIVRGDLPQTSAMELLQIGYLHSVVAAAGCSLGAPFPDRGIDWTVNHESTQHALDPEASIKISLKSTSTVAPNPSGDHFSFRVENDHLLKLEASPVLIPRILVVMLVPTSWDDWIDVGTDNLTINHCCYWVNLAGEQHTLAASGKTTVHIPTANVFDAAALCGIMQRVGSGVRA
ncbi:DUF4365 domain-containing protein [Pseudarthrobacter sp. NPDC059871]|uniref:DUF4365 domain-containing protein n=2 Tax=unclassified Pseudarthrobacter TaxID=2647000 RepID=UPI003659A76A